MELQLGMVRYGNSQLNFVYEMVRVCYIEIYFIESFYLIYEN